MANEIRGEFEFAVDGDKFQIQYDVNRMCALEALMGRSAGDMVTSVTPGNQSVTRAFFWAGVRGFTGDGKFLEQLDLSEAGEVLFKYGLAKSCALILKAVDAAFPAPRAASKKGSSEADADPTTKAAKGGTGKPSSDAG